MDGASGLIIEHIENAAIMGTTPGTKRPGLQDIFEKAHLDYASREVDQRLEQLDDLQKQWLEQSVLEVR